MKKLLAVTATGLLLLGLFAQPSESVDHSSYNRILQEHVSGGYFDYKGFVNDSDARSRLKNYRYRLSQVNPDQLNKNEALTYWINLYNASTIHLIADNYPVDSIKDLGGWLSSPFEKKFIPGKRGKLSLDNIEHDIIRPGFNEPRIHFALVCAARSCPPLRDEAYTAGSLDKQLEDQARLFIRSDKNRFHVKDGKLSMKLSSIFYWYGEDFGGEDGLAKYLKAYLEKPKQKLIESGDYTIEYVDYDWGLNQTPGPYDL